MDEIENATISFRQRVLAFWHLFLEQEYEIRYLLNSLEDFEAADKLLGGLLATVFQHPVFLLRKQEEYYQLEVSADGDISRLYGLNYWRMQAPSVIEEQWDILVGKLTVEDPTQVEVRMEGLSIRADEIEVWPLFEPGGRLGLEYYSLEMLQLKPDMAYTLFCTMLEQCIGELCLMTNIAYINMLEAANFEEPLLLSELADFIADWQLAGQLPPQNDPLGLYSDYEMTEQDGMWELRKDIRFGNVSAAALPVLNCYYAQVDYLFWEQAEEGLIWGFLFYSGAGLTAEQRMHVCNGLEEDLNRIAAREQGVGECVGIAIGLEYMYLDCVCYDWDAFLEIAAQLLQSYGALYQIQTGGFSQLYKGGQTIKLL